MDQGITPERYRVIPRTLIFVLHRSRVLLLRRAKHKAVGPGLYNGVGGHIEPGEDVLSAAYRELREETGLTDVTLHLCGTAMVDVRPVGVLLFVFRGELPEDQTPALRPTTEGELTWIPIERLGQHALVPDLYVLLPRVLEWRLSEPVFHALITPQPDGQVRVRFGG
ncbi:MAG: NUDIX domain-containing protein [Chloroflexi bacterium]|nr:NUDIX domain-containing protein [Chloroflexota bacterium]